MSADKDFGHTKADGSSVVYSLSCPYCEMIGEKGCGRGGGRCRQCGTTRLLSDAAPSTSCQYGPLCHECYMYWQIPVAVSAAATEHHIQVIEHAGNTVGHTVLRDTIRYVSELQKRIAELEAETRALMCGDDNSEHPGTGRLLSATPVSAKKPPVPSDIELQRIYDHAEGGHDEGMAELWLAGYHARDSHIAELEDITRDREKTIVAVTGHNARLRERIVELEAEVAELRKRAETAESNYRFMVERAADQKLDGYRELAAKVADAKNKLDSAPRRTPELTERVARHLLAEYGTEYDGTPWEDLTDSGRAWFLEEADAVLDLVFGKERSDG